MNSIMKAAIASALGSLLVIAVIHVVKKRRAAAQAAAPETPTVVPQPQAVHIDNDIGEPVLR